MTAALEDQHAAETTERVSVHGKGVLTGLLSDVLLCASTDATAPDVLRAVRLHVEAGKLHGWSTNRFIASHGVVDALDGSAADAVVLPTADVKAVVSRFKAAVWVEYAVDRERATVTFTDGGASVVARMVDGEFPNMTHVAKVELPELSGVFGFNPDVLAPVVKIAKRRKETLVMHAGGSTLAHVRIGASFRAWAMPMRIDSCAPTVDWLGAEF